MKHINWLILLNISVVIALFFALTILSPVEQYTHSNIVLCDYPFVEIILAMHLSKDYADFYDQAYEIVSGKLKPYVLHGSKSTI